MQPIRKRLSKLAEEELLVLSKAIDSEMLRRQHLQDAVSESVDRRAMERTESYHRAQESAMPARVASVRKSQEQRRAA